MLIDDEIKILIEQFRPFLQKDGGDIEFLGIDEQNNVIIRFLESCLDCKLKEQTKKIIELQLKKRFQQLNGVVEKK